MPEEFVKLERVRVADLDAILGQPFKVLDHGFVRVVDYMGSDESIVQAARVSYGQGTKKISQDRELIRYLMRHQHTSPFEMCEIKLHVRVPMDTWRQWIRHRTANVNEYSTRYSVAIEAAQKTPPDQWRKQGIANRQGSSGWIESDVGERLSHQEAKLQELARNVYRERLEAGVAREQARKDLPLSTYTEAYWKIDLHNLLHFLELRLDSLAQQEIRAYAEVISQEIVRPWCPITWEAFWAYRRQGLSLSDMEIQIISACASGDPQKATDQAMKMGLLKMDNGQFKSTLELTEIEAKLERLHLPLPWRK